MYRPFHSLAMLPGAADKIAGHADIERAGLPVAHHVNGDGSVAGTIAGTVFMGARDNGPAMTKILEGKFSRG
jgi:hypothetical protein